MKFRISAVSLSYVVLVLLFPNKSAAVPSYSRQTGLSCASCHYAPPELNAFGRKFKLEGYTFATKPEVSEDKKDHNSSLHLLESFPLSVLFDTSFTSTKSPQPATQNGNFEFPQAASLFLAGSCGSHVGSFVQVTYDSQADHFTWDNTDIRYANNSGHLFGKSLTYGATLNNNPTVEDLWNSTPAWGFPFGSSNSAPSPERSGYRKRFAGAGCRGFRRIHDVERSFVPGGYALSLRTHWRIAAESRNRIRIQRSRHRSLLAPRVAELHCEQQL